MKILIKVVTVIAFAACLATIYYQYRVISAQRVLIESQHQTMNDLIDLNHDKSEYIDSGCTEPFEGSEERLSH
jgi:hypothetical protein